MKLKQLLNHFLLTLLPTKYKNHTEKQFGQALTLYFGILIISLVLSFLLFIPVIDSRSDSISEIMSGFETLNISIDFQTSTPVTLLETPLVKIDSNATDRNDEKLLFGKDSVFYKKNIFQEKTNPMITTIDLTTKTSDLQKLYFIGALLLLPAYILSLGLFITIVLFLLITFISMILMISFKKKDYSFRDFFMTGLHASLFGVVIFLIALPFYNALWISAIIFVVLYILGLLFLKGHKFESIKM